MTFFFSQNIKVRAFVLPSFSYPSLVLISIWDLYDRLYSNSYVSEVTINLVSQAFQVF
jgi:hypothetical protein